MALPLIPIILAVASLGSGLIQGISATKNTNNQVETIKEATQEKIDDRAKQAKKLMQQQKTSFLKSGVYFNSGTPLEVINETYNTMGDDINAMAKDANIKINNLERQGKTAFISSLLQGVTNSAMTFLSTSAMGDKISTATKSSNFGSGFKNWWSNLRPTKVSGDGIENIG